MLPVQKDSIPPYVPLTGRALENLRNIYRHVKLFVIDEFSFLSYEVLRSVSLRLREFGSEEHFGGYIMLLVGTFTVHSYPQPTK